MNMNISQMNNEHDDDDGDGVKCEEEAELRAGVMQTATYMGC